MNEELIVDPRDAIIARQAVELEEIKRAFNELVGQFDAMNKLIAQVKSLGRTFNRFE